MGVVMFPGANPNDTHFYAYIRETTAYAIPEWIIAATVPMSVPQFFKTFHIKARQFMQENSLNKPLPTIFQPNPSLPHLSSWKPAGDNVKPEPDELKYIQCVQNGGSSSSNLGQGQSSINSTGVVERLINAMKPDGVSDEPFDSSSVMEDDEEEEDDDILTDYEIKLLFDPMTVTTSDNEN